MGRSDPKSGTRWPGRKNGTRCPGTRWIWRDKSRNQNGTLLVFWRLYKPKSETKPIQYICLACRSKQAKKKTAPPSTPPPTKIYCFAFKAPHPSHIFSSGTTLSCCVLVCKNVCLCFQISSLKPLGQLKPNFMWNLHGIGEESLFKWSR